MEKEDINLLAQLLTGMKDALGKLEEAKSRKDVDTFNEAKKEILNIQQQIDKEL